MIGKFVTKLIQSLPTWEVTKYYGRVCIYQLQCLKYKVQTSEAWFNFKCKFMPGSLRNELECEEPIENKVKKESKQQKAQQKMLSETVKSQNKAQYNSKDSTLLKDIKDSHIIDEFEVNVKKQDKKGDKKYPMHEDYATKKQRKVKRAQ